MVSLLLVFEGLKDKFESTIFIFILVIGNRLVQERIQMGLQKLLQYRWQRFMRGRSYRHLLEQLGYK